MVLLEKIIVGAAGAASVTFSNIPQTGYNDLVIKVSARDTTTAYASSAGISWQVQFNGLTTNLSARYFFQTSSGVDASNIYGTNPTGLDTANTFGNGEVYIPNYTSSNYKSMNVDAVSETNGASAGMRLNAGIWSATAAITSVKILAYSAFAQYSTFSLYGVSNVSTTPLVAPKATGGDIIQTDGTYWYHAFINSGTFTPAVGLTCDYLVVAGGGGASRLCGAGAGGLRSTVTATGGGGSLESALTLTSGTSYTVTIGAGGAGSTVIGGNTALRGYNGVNSVFGSITSIGGGGGADGNAAGYSGGSGGGGWNPGAGGAGTTNQGYAGGSAATYGGGLPYGQGGGGGAGGVGQAAQSGNIAGVGGIGVAISALATATGTGVSNYYAGGGGGSSDSSVTSKAGGAGGGGTGGGGGGTGDATANTGGGGGAQGGTSNGGGNGGSGIIIVRYTVA
jgi:hypothetical protein